MWNWVIDTEAHGIESRMTYVFDLSRDHVPVTFGQSVRVRREGAKWSPPVRRGATTWRKIADVYVPVSFEGVLNTMSDDRRQIEASQSMTVSMEWHDVNAAIDPKEFSVESLEDRPGETMVFDNRSGRPRMVQHPKLDAGRLAEAEAARWARIDVPAAGGLPARRWILAVNAAVTLLSVIAWSIWKWRRRRLA